MRLRQPRGEAALCWEFLCPQWGEHQAHLLVSRYGSCGTGEMLSSFEFHQGGLLRSHVTPNETTWWSGRRSEDVSLRRVSLLTCCRTLVCLSGQLPSMETTSEEATQCPKGVISRAWCTSGCCFQARSMQARGGFLPLTLSLPPPCLPTSNSASPETAWEGDRGGEQSVEGGKNQLFTASLAISWQRWAGAREGKRFQTGQESRVMWLWLRNGYENNYDLYFLF